MRFNSKKRKKKEKKRIQITSKQTSRGINCSSLSLSSLKILHSYELFSEVEVARGRYLLSFKTAN